MATKLAQMPPKRGRGRTHPWNEWADGSAWVIRQGDDFPGQLESMRVRLYSKARELGKDLEIQVDKDAGAITFQMKDKPETA